MQFLATMHLQDSGLGEHSYNTMPQGTKQGILTLVKTFLEGNLAPELKGEIKNLLIRLNKDDQVVQHWHLSGRDINFVAVIRLVD